MLLNFEIIHLVTVGTDLKHVLSNINWNVIAENKREIEKSY